MLTEVNIIGIVINTAKSVIRYFYRIKYRLNLVSEIGYWNQPGNLLSLKTLLAAEFWGLKHNISYCDENLLNPTKENTENNSGYARYASADMYGCGHLFFN